MKSNKSKRCMVSNSENFNPPQVASNSNLNQQFWHSLKDTINTKKENQSIKGRIFTAKRILTPIIQQLMKDALEQIDAEEVEEAELGKEVKVLYNNVEAKDIWHVQADHGTEGEEWAMRILREISRDFEQPFDKLHKKVDDNGTEDQQQSPKDILLNKRLLTKMVAIHQHLGNIIERLKEKCNTKKTADVDRTSSNYHRNQAMKAEIHKLLENAWPASGKPMDNHIKSYNMQSFGVGQSSEANQTQRKYSRLDERGKMLKVENACSPINLDNVEKAGFSVSQKLLYDVGVSYHTLFEENKNDIGNKEIVIKCLEDLEKVRTYLESLRDDTECEKPRFSDLESCKNYGCLESQPHLHSKHHNVPMVLKLNKHAEDNERNSDLIIGIPSLTTSTPDVHILLHTKDQQVDIKQATERADRTKNQNKNTYRISRIPKPVADKRRGELGSLPSSNSMRITLENMETSRRKPANVLIFDPDDPCNSIIKMKEQKNGELNDSRSVVSSTGLQLKFREILILELSICCVGGKITGIKLNIGISLLIQWVFGPGNSRFIFLHLTNFCKMVLIIHYSVAATTRAFHLIIKIFDIFRFNAKKNCIWRNTSEALMFNHEGFLDNYIRHILNFTSSIKGPSKGTSTHKNECFQKNNHQHVFDSYAPERGVIHQVYFFECFKESDKKDSCASRKKWDEKSQNVATYPVWTIKRSKYYSVPQTKKVSEAVFEKQVVEPEQQGDNESTKLEGDSLEEVVEPTNGSEIQIQVSQVSVRSIELPREVESDADADNVPKKKEIRRKVSFRDEVDISGFERNNSEDRNLDTEEYNNYPDSPTCDQTFYEGVNYTLEKSPSLDFKEDARKLTSRISDLLMTDSLMQMAEVIPNSGKEKLKSSLKKRSVNNLKLTDSAKQVLAKLSKSFVDDEYTKTSGILTIDLVPQFYDQEGNPITEIRNIDGNVIFKLNKNNFDELASVLFDSAGIFLKNRYDAKGKRIKAVYDVDGRIIRRISENEDDIKSIQTDLKNIEYYDYKGKPIQKLYDSSGYEIKTVGRDLTSKIFDADGRLRKNIYTGKGRRIDAVFDYDGRLIGKTSNNQLEPVVRSEIRVAKMDGDSVNKLFETDNKSAKIEKKEEENPHERKRSPKRLFDQEGNPLIGVYDKKGKPIKLTSSGEADELLPFLFDDKGKLQSERFDSKGKELKAVFGEDGKAISEMSIAWLNELLANSKHDSPKGKKKGSFFKRMSKSKVRPEKRSDIEKLYDSKGKVITSIFDSKGKPLAVSVSGDANKLIPFLFDSDGKFVKKIYDSEKRKMRCVYGKDGNVINSISVPYLEQILSKLGKDKERNELDEKNKQQKENEENLSSLKVSQETMENDEVKSSHSLDCFEKVPDQLFDQDGDVLTEIFDWEGNVLAATSSGNAWKLLPHLFDHKGQFLKNRFDRKKRELSAVYNKEGDNLNDDLSSVIKVTVAKSSAYNDKKEDSDKNPEGNAQDETRNEVEIEKDCENNLKENEHKKIQLKGGPQNEQKDSYSKLGKTVSSISSTETPSKINVTSKKSSNSEQVELVRQKGKHERKQLKPTTSITEKQSINQKLIKTEASLKAGESIYRFYDERGNTITEVYDSKGRKLIRTRSEDVELLSKYLFDKKGFLFENIYDRKGRKITQIFDEKRRNISRISMPSVISGDNISSKHHEKNEKIPGSVYDKHGNLVKKIYDKKGHPIIVTKLAKLEDLAPVIFDEKGVRRRIFDKSGYEIGSVYDYKGNELKRFSTKKPKSASDCRDTRIFSKSGRPLRNFYDSEGTLIIALYNDYGKTLCSVRKGVDNVEKLSKFFFDKEGQFLRGRFYNFRGQMIKHVYDSDNNIVRSIKKTASRKIAHYKYSNRDGEKVSHRKHTNKINPKVHNNETSKLKQRTYHGKSEVRPVENVIGNFSSQSETMLNPATPLVQRSMSAYSLRDYPKRKEIKAQSVASSTSLTNMSIKKFYDEHGRLLTGVYNSKTRLLGYSASGNARVLAPYLFDTKGNFISGRYNLDRKPLKNIYDSNGKLVEKISKPILNKTKETKKASKKSKGFKFHDLNGDEITSVYNLRGEKILDVTGSCEKIANLFDKNGNFKKNLYNYRGSELKVYEVGQEIDRRGSIMEDIFNSEKDDPEKKNEKESAGSKGRFSVLSSFKDKILTVIFDNQHKLSQRLSPQTFKKKGRQYMEGEKGDKKTNEGIQKGKSNLYDKNLNLIKDIYDERGKVIKKLYNSDGEVIGELYSASGTLVKNNVLQNLFEKSVFRPKVFNSEGNLISTIYANKKLLKKVFDEKGGPAEVDSELIYLVSDRSLPDDASPATSKSETKQVNYFSEGKFSWFFTKLKNEM